jgi:hypothetical protein
MKSLNKFLILSFFIFSIPSIGFALPKCGNSLHNCTGTYTWENGDVYDGDWKNNKMDGLGTFYYKKSGNEYDGDWKNNKKHGFGTYYWNDGDKYVGDFLNDKKHGKGRYTWKSGSKYEGDWVNGKRTGEGVLTFANGKKQEGVFKNSKFLYSKKINKQRNINKDNENPLSLALNKKPVEIKKPSEKINKKTVKVKPFKIIDLKEYNSKKSIGWSKVNPAIKFLIEQPRIWTEFFGGYKIEDLFVEKAWECGVQIRYNLPVSERDKYGKVEKFVMNFNKINWNTKWESYDNSSPLEWTVRYQCPEGCYGYYGHGWGRKYIFGPKDTIRWYGWKDFEFTVDDNIYSRFNNAMSDIRKSCNASTSKY